MKKPIPLIPMPGQESVWDYPRPPRLEPVRKRIQIKFNGEWIAETTHGYRVLETSHPPVYYLPPEDIRTDCIFKDVGSSYCEWKGSPQYVGVKVGNKTLSKAGWYYPTPTPPFQPITNYIAFYAGLMDECRIDDEVVTPQPGGFYGGWITKDIVGPFKGEPGTLFW